MLNNKKLSLGLADVLVILSALIFSIWLMFSTFYYKDGIIYITAKAWSDFSGTLPLIRSFSSVPHTNTGRL